MAPVGPWMSGQGALRFGLNAAAVSAAVALICFGWSYIQMPDYLLGQSFFELLFWGGGHVLQFTYTLLMLVCLAVVEQPRRPASFHSPPGSSCSSCLWAWPAYFVSPLDLSGIPQSPPWSMLSCSPG